METSQEIIKAIKSLCEKALEGMLTLNNFQEMWPEKKTPMNPFFRQIYEDIENGIEHTPGFFFKRGTDYKSWHKSDMYFTIYLDFLLLGYDKGADVLLQCHKFVLGQKNLSEEIIKDKVKEYFKE